MLELAVLTPNVQWTPTTQFVTAEQVLEEIHLLDVMRLRSIQLLLEILATHHHAEKIPNVLYWMEEQSVNV